ncbi:MAG: metallophosphoesterase [Bacilli bacterium]|nr:metallophosphoesterase [Bacilli bacterium]
MRRSKEVIEEDNIIEDEITLKDEEEKQENPKRKKIFKTIKYILLIILIMYGYTRYFESYFIKVNEYPIINSNIPQNFNGLKIVQFSDIHLGSTTNINTIKRVVKKINYLEPDIVIYNGDLFDKFSNVDEEDVKTIIKELKKINVTIGSYAIIGDDDYESIENYITIMEDANFKVLDNEHELIFYNNGNTPILLTGISSKIDMDKINDTSLYNDISIPYKIGIIHEPDTINELADNNYNLILAGHSIGGQIRLPYTKGLIKIKGARTYISDYYQVNDTELYINNGIGTKTTKIRFLNRSSINLYRLYNK